MTSRTFRESMNSLGWSRREPDTLDGTNPSSRPILSKLKSLNPFGSGGYVQLPAQDVSAAPLPAPTRREEEESWFACESRGFPCGVVRPSIIQVGTNGRPSVPDS